ncbi:MAG: response regulator transcription factor [Bacteroidota bacterium]
MKEKQILLLEDDKSFGYILSEYLGMQEFKVTWVKSAEEALKVLEKKQFHLAILDIMLPGMNGFELAAIIKEQHSELPFIFLSAKSLKIDQLKGYKTGAYDYITKPIDEELLVAKIKALLSQTQKTEQRATHYQIGAYQFFPELFQLVYRGVAIKLTARETAVLRLLCEHQNRLLPRKKALKQIWGANDEFNRKSMDVFVSHLRKHLAKDPLINIENVHNQGFILKC